MVQVTFGEKSWEEDSASVGTGRSDFFNMKDDGQYTMRICGKPYEFAAHWYEINGKRNKVNCAGKDCVLCGVSDQKAAKASVRYLVPVIVKSGPGLDKSGVYVTEFGPQVYGQIRGLYKTPAWGNPMHYDIMIDKNKSRGAQGTYFTTPGGAKEPFTKQEEAEIREFMERIKIQDFVAPSSNGDIREKLGPDGCAKFGISSSNSSKAAPATDDFDFTSSTESDFDFSAG